jgi:hypothetical protein
MVPNNFEPPELYWFRKVDHHPDAAKETLAQAFCGEVASWMGIERPTLYWFEEADVGAARQNWRDSPHWGRPASDDPLRQQSCQYFRWRCGSAGRVFHGYTHFDYPLGVMINTVCFDEDLLKAIAEECFHINQDICHGPEWRRNNENAAEQEAKEYVGAKNAEIRVFLREWQQREQTLQ